MIAGDLRSNTGVVSRELPFSIQYHPDLEFLLRGNGVASGGVGEAQQQIGILATDHQAAWFPAGPQRGVRGPEIARLIDRVAEDVARQIMDDVGGFIGAENG